MKQLLINDLKNFYEIIIELNLQEESTPMVFVYKNTLGGCSCNKEKRKSHADIAYINFVTTPHAKTLFDKIKTIKNVDSIIVKHKDRILKEF